MGFRQAREYRWPAHARGGNDEAMEEEEMTTASRTPAMAVPATSAALQVRYGLVRYGKDPLRALGPALRRGAPGRRRNAGRSMASSFRPEPY